jgi:hypothetical protein
MTGSFPAPGLEVDHINHDPFDDRFANLRLVTRSQNMFNSRRPNSLGVKGVYRRGRSFRAKIRGEGGRRIHLGTFPTPDAAAQAYREAAAHYHGQFACFDVSPSRTETVT